MLDKVSGDLIYPPQVLHAAGHNIVDHLRDNLNISTRQEVMGYMRNEDHLKSLAQEVMFRDVQVGVPSMLQAPVVRFETQDLNPDGVVSREVEVFEFMSRIADAYTYENKSYIRTESGYVFNVTDTVLQISEDLPAAIESVLDELNIQ